MPIYEYQCESCGHSFEHFARSMGGNEKVACPSCGQKKAQRQLSVFAARDGGNSASMPQGPCGQCGSADGACPFSQ